MKNTECHSFPLAHACDLTWGLPGAGMLGVYQGIFFFSQQSLSGEFVSLQAIMRSGLKEKGHFSGGGN